MVGVTPQQIADKANRVLGLAASINAGHITRILTELDIQLKALEPPDITVVLRAYDRAIAQIIDANGLSHDFLDVARKLLLAFEAGQA